MLLNNCWLMKMCLLDVVDSIVMVVQPRSVDSLCAHLTVDVNKDVKRRKAWGWRRVPVYPHIILHPRGIPIVNQLVMRWITTVRRRKFRILSRWWMEVGWWISRVCWGLPSRVFLLSPSPRPSIFFSIMLYYLVCIWWSV